MAWRCRFLAARPSQVGRVIAGNDPTHWLISTQATGLRGLLFFVGTYVLGSVALLTRMRCNPTDYTSESLTKFVIAGAPGYALSFVLFWTLAYALVHIY